MNIWGVLFTAEGAKVFAEERREKLKSDTTSCAGLFLQGDESVMLASMIASPLR
jgi:hypothetical protein